MSEISNTRLSRVPGGGYATIKGFSCPPRQLSRLAPLGLIRGARLAVIRNRKGHALIIASGHTTIALARQVAAAVTVGDVHV